MTVFDTIVIAVVEGLTEFLPVSSTGHMIIAQQLLGVESTPFVKAFTVIIQFGAILSVVCLYWKRFFKLRPCAVFGAAAAGSCGKRKGGGFWRRLLYRYDFYWKLLVGFVPAAFFGLLFSDKIDELLESVAVVAVMLVAGGILMLFVDRLFREEKADQTLSEKNAFYIGLFQCAAMIPGVSRSMATIVGGMAQKLSRKNAAEFSFFLAVPTMFAATAYKAVKLFSDPAGSALLAEHLSALVLGNAVAFAVALLAIRFFIGYVTRYGFRAFGYYRILAGGILLLLLGWGYDLQIG